ncbi:Predicted membrane protein [Mycobacteroides abscessus subsp. abscessus]|nr:Predicted membrane protein [Mycobacteroides abscessus subsp. abscessus]
MMKWIYYFLTHRTILWFLLVVNILGTIYAYYWYRYQLAETPPIFLIFVPDSPTACLFFVFVLIAFILGKNWPLFEALAMVTLFKYGIWAVVMNYLVLVVSGELDIIGYMLMLSHGAMALQGLLYAPFYRFKAWHLIVTGIWTLHNDVIDYVFKMLPRYHMLDDYIPQIGYFTFWLSIVSLALAYWFVVRGNSKKMELTI